MYKKYLYSYVKRSVSYNGLDVHWYLEEYHGRCNTVKEIEEVYNKVSKDKDIDDFKVEITYYIENPFEYKNSKGE